MDAGLLLKYTRGQNIFPSSDIDFGIKSEDTKKLVLFSKYIKDQGYLVTTIGNTNVITDNVNNANGNCRSTAASGGGSDSAFGGDSAAGSTRTASISLSNPAGPTTATRRKGTAVVSTLQKVQFSSTKHWKNASDLNLSFDSDSNSK